MPATWNATNPVTVGAATKKDHYDRAFDNLLVLREGGLALPSGAALDFIYSLTSGQLGRKAKGTALQVPRINAAANDWEFAAPADATARAGGIVLASAADLDFIYGLATGLARKAAGGALTYPRINAAGTDWEFAAAAASPGALLLYANSGSSAGVAATTADSYAVPAGLTALDQLLISVEISSTDNNVNTPSVYNSTSSVTYASIAENQQHHFLQFRVMKEPSRGVSTVGIKGNNSGTLSLFRLVPGGAWGAGFTLQLNYASQGGAATTWVWAIHKLVGNNYE